jgi:hypothetical protein
MDLAIEEVCAVCPRPGKLCSGCRNVYYCCRSHQKDDWPTHKLVCKKFACRPDHPHPGKIWVVYFPADCTEPEVITIALDPLGAPVWNGACSRYQTPL